MKVKHGGNIYEVAEKFNIDEKDIIDFSANINPLGIPESLKKTIITNLDTLDKYPDPNYKSLTASIANYEGVDEDYIVPGNGATEIIFLLIEALKPKKALTLAPTFLEYDRALKRNNCHTQYYYLDEKKNYKIDKQDLLDKITEDLDLLIICNPNNPTGQIIGKEDLEEILKRCKEKEVFLMMDEAFIDFVHMEEKKSMKSFINKFNNLLIIKAMTKFFAIPGLRLGYGLTSNLDIIEKISNIKMPWSINSFASLAGKTLLEDKDYILESKKFFVKERDYIYKKLNEIDKIRVFKPEANYVFLKLLVDDIDFKERLIKRKILIRHCDNYINLSNRCYRVAIKDRYSNDKLINSLKEVLYEG